MRVSETAARLASAYGADVEQARIAGVLHDWDRERGPEGLLAAAREAGVEISDIDERVPYLLHPRTAAADPAVMIPRAGSTSGSGA